MLAVFQGADAYITPSWYATKQETGKVVPTWNYAMVQVRGRAQCHPRRRLAARQIGALTGEQEAVREHAWPVGDAPDAYIAAQIKGIVGVEIEILEIDGKWKVSQNRPAADIVALPRRLAMRPSRMPMRRWPGWCANMAQAGDLLMNNDAPLTIAIDGPAASGKGTLARRLADYYHLPHLDTGLTYRAVGHALLIHGLPLDNVSAAETAARQVDLGKLDREVLSAHEVGDAASKVAVFPSVRRILVEKQRAFAAAARRRGARRPRHRHRGLPGRRREALRHGERRGARRAAGCATSRPRRQGRSRRNPRRHRSAATSATWAAPTRRSGPPPTRTCSIRRKCL